MSLEDAVIGLKAYREVNQRATRLWDDFNKAIILPRMDITRDSLPGIHIQNVSLRSSPGEKTSSNAECKDTLEARGSADKSVKSLLRDLERVFSFLVQRLPPDLVEIISGLLPTTVHSVTSVWLDSAVPSSLKDMEKFQDVIADARHFCSRLKALGFSSLGDLQEWTENAPRVWLSKCREAALDSVRIMLSQGLGASKKVEKVEKQMVSRVEGEQLLANGATASADDHGWDAWDDEEQEQPQQPVQSGDSKPSDEGDDDGADAWGWGDEDAGADEPKEEHQDKKPDEEEDPVEAWGWGDETNNDEAETTEKDQAEVAAQPKPQTRELILKETYSISSIPQPVLDLVFSIVEDGATLTQDSHADNPVAAAATGLFSLPTLALAMFRAVSPHYYAPSAGGSM